MTPHAEAAPADPTPVGVVLGGRYELRSMLGTGGSGAVYLAHDRVLARDVAVKQLRPGQDDLAQARLRSEARIAGALAHPGIARLLDLGEDPGPAGPVPYLVMEHVDGRTLREVLRTGERLSVDVVLRLLGQIAEALAVVHAAGIVHRDLKPGNIVLARDGRAVLLDFGIARHHSEEPLTLTGTIVGTVDYISPEQAAGSSASAASDIYALGTLAYECLTGLRPLSRDTQVSTLMAHAGTPVPPLPPSFPDGVRDLVAAMVALDPAARPDGALVAQRVRELLHEPMSTGSVAAPLPRPVASATVGHARAARRRHVLAAGCAAVLALVAGWALMSRTHEPAAVAAADPAGTSSSASASPTARPAPHRKTTPSPSAAATVVAAPAVHAARHPAPRPAPAVRHVRHVHHHHGPVKHHAGPGHGHGPGHAPGHGAGKSKHHGHGKG